MLTDGCSAMECVCKAITMPEDCDLFNAGKGSVFTANGEHEMDTAIMDEQTLRAGAVAGLQGVKNQTGTFICDGKYIAWHSYHAMWKTLKK